jgi:murein L,D-transpeptidase YcbB/YkuD
VAAAFAMPLSARVAPLPGAAGAAVRLGPVAQAIREQLAKGAGDPSATAFYRARDDRPIWVRGWRMKPEAERLLEFVRASGDDGLDPRAYGVDELASALQAARSGRPADLARAELAASRAFAHWATDLHTPVAGAKMAYADPGVAPPAIDPLGVLQYAARASTAVAVPRLAKMNLIYDQYRAAFAAWRAHGGTAEDGKVILANLERARALPPELGRRFILVNAAAQRLWLYEDGEPVDSMDVVVGKPSEPTPALAGLIRYAVARPYWNVPADLVQHEIAPKVLRLGPGYLASRDMEALSDWGPDAHVVDPASIDWRAVASGAQLLRVRQRPGPENMMGRVKFIFPNRFGVYLHDTPLRQYFAEKQRTESAGCVRLAHAPELAERLLGGEARRIDEAGPPEAHIDLQQPVPVYIAYFTARPTAQGLVFHPDIYGRDAKLEASLTATRSVAPAATSPRRA